MHGYEHANGIALDLWEEVYPNSLLLALTDTFSTKAFFQVRLVLFTHFRPRLPPLKLPPSTGE
jgi:nicotinic acid phosphoribosyltransferase